MRREKTAWEIIDGWPNILLSFNVRDDDHLRSVEKVRAEPHLIVVPRTNGGLIRTKTTYLMKLKWLNQSPNGGQLRTKRAIQPVTIRTTMLRNVMAGKYLAPTNFFS